MKNCSLFYKMQLARSNSLLASFQKVSHSTRSELRQLKLTGGDSASGSFLQVTHNSSRRSSPRRRSRRRPVPHRRQRPTLHRIHMWHRLTPAAQSAEEVVLEVRGVQVLLRAAAEVPVEVVVEADSEVVAVHPPRLRLNPTVITILQQLKKRPRHPSCPSPPVPVGLIDSRRLHQRSKHPRSRPFPMWLPMSRRMPLLPTRMRRGNKLRWMPIRGTKNLAQVLGATSLPRLLPRPLRQRLPHSRRQSLLRLPCRFPSRAPASQRRLFRQSRRARLA